MTKDLHGIQFNNEENASNNDKLIMTTDGLMTKSQNVRDNRWNEPPVFGESVPTKYVVKVNGVVISMAYVTPTLAYDHLGKLPMETQLMAEVVQVDAKGNELLLG